MFRARHGQLRQRASNCSINSVAAPRRPASRCGTVRERTRRRSRQQPTANGTAKVHPGLLSSWLGRSPSPPLPPADGMKSGARGRQTARQSRGRPSSSFICAPPVVPGTASATPHARPARPRPSRVLLGGRTAAFRGSRPVRGCRCRATVRGRVVYLVACSCAWRSGCGGGIGFCTRSQISIMHATQGQVTANLSSRLLLGEARAGSLPLDLLTHCALKVGLGQTETSTE